MKPDIKRMIDRFGLAGRARWVKYYEEGMLCDKMPRGSGNRSKEDHRARVAVGWVLADVLLSDPSKFIPNPKSHRHWGKASSAPDVISVKTGKTIEPRSLWAYASTLSFNRSTADFLFLWISTPPHRWLVFKCSDLLKHPTTFSTRWQRTTREIPMSWLADKVVLQIPITSPLIIDPPTQEEQMIGLFTDPVIEEPPSMYDE
jgi:hypothetical protein